MVSLTGCNALKLPVDDLLVKSGRLLGFSLFTPFDNDDVTVDDNDKEGRDERLSVLDVRCFISSVPDKVSVYISTLLFTVRMGEFNDDFIALLFIFFR